MSASSVRNRAFSLIELVIVVVIIGIIAAIAIPRMSRGATGAAENSLKADLAMLRNAIELFQTENGGTYPTGANIVDALTKWSNGSGGVDNGSTRPATGYPYGPYLKEIPELPMGSNKGAKTVGTTAGAGIAWVYNATSHEINANTGNATYDGW